MNPILNVEMGDLGVARHSSNSPNASAADATHHREPSPASQSVSTQDTTQDRRPSPASEASAASGATHVEENQPLERFTKEDVRYRDGRNERSCHPWGWPTHAAFRDSYNNLHIYRDFGYMNTRLAIHYEWLAGKLEGELLAFDKGHTDHLISGTSPEYEDLLGRMNEVLRKHAEVIDRMQNLRKGEEVHHEVLMEYLRDLWKHHGGERDLENGLYAGMNAFEEFRSFEPQDSGWLIWILHTQFGRWLVSKLFNDPHWHGYPAQSTIIFLQMLRAILTVLLLLVPSGILFLQDLNKSQAFAVMICSTIIFCSIVSAVQKARNTIENTCIAGCAYVAILAAFAVARYFGVGCDEVCKIL